MPGDAFLTSLQHQFSNLSTRLEQDGGGGGSSADFDDDVVYCGGGGGDVLPQVASDMGSGKSVCLCVD